MIDRLTRRRCDRASFDIVVIVAVLSAGGVENETYEHEHESQNATQRSLADSTRFFVCSIAVGLPTTMKEVGAARIAEKLAERSFCQPRFDGQLAAVANIRQELFEMTNTLMDVDRFGLGDDSTCPNGEHKK